MPSSTSVPQKSTILIIAACSLFLTVVVVGVWTGPTEFPPEGNTYAPLTIGSGAQVKGGDLTVSNLFLTAASQGDIKNINLLQGVDDPMLYSNDSKTAPIYLEGSVVAINNDSGTGNVAIGAASANQKLEINGGVRPNTVTSKLACSMSSRGTFWFTQGATGVKDSVEVYPKDAANAYSWRLIY